MNNVRAKQNLAKPAKGQWRNKYSRPAITDQSYDAKTFNSYTAIETTPGATPIRIQPPICQSDTAAS